MRNFLHYLVSVLLWILFGYYWYVVVERQISRESLQPLVILTGITVDGEPFEPVYMRLTPRFVTGHTLD